MEQPMEHPCYCDVRSCGKNSIYLISKAVARGSATGACAPPFSKKKKNPHLVKKKCNMNKQNFDLTFLGKFLY